MNVLEKDLQAQTKTHPTHCFDFLILVAPFKKF